MLRLGSAVESSLFDAADLNIEPGTLHISSLTSEVVTVRATVLCTVHSDVVRRIAIDCLEQRFLS